MAFMCAVPTPHATLSKHTPPLRYFTLVRPDSRGEQILVDGTQLAVRCPVRLTDGRTKSNASNIPQLTAAPWPFSAGCSAAAP